MATIQDFEERIEKQKAELAKLEAKKKGTLKRRFASGTGSGALWSPIPLVKVCSPPSVALGRNSTSTHSTDSLASHADEVSDMTPRPMKIPLRMPRRVSDARKKKTVKTEPVADGGLQAAEPDSENSDW